MYKLVVQNSTTAYTVSYIEHSSNLAEATHTIYILCVEGGCQVEESLQYYCKVLDI